MSRLDDIERWLREREAELAAMNHRAEPPRKYILINNDTGERIETAESGYVYTSPTNDDTRWLVDRVRELEAGINKALDRLPDAPLTTPTTRPDIALVITYLRNALIQDTEDES